MKFSTSLFFIIGVAALSSAAQATEARIKDGHRYGCTERSIFDKTLDMVSQQDMEAFQKLLGAGLTTGNCVMFDAGERLIVSENGLFRLKVRRKGDPREYWIDGDSILR